MYKLYRSKRSKRLHRQINVGGAIHNHAIALHKRYYRLYKKHLSLYTLHAHLAKLKRLPKYAWWRQLGSQAIQEIARRIDKGYQRFFAKICKSARRGRPRGGLVRPLFARFGKRSRSP